MGLFEILFNFQIKKTHFSSLGCMNELREIQVVEINENRNEIF